MTDIDDSPAATIQQTGGARHPQLAEGVVLHGQYMGGGHKQPRYLVARSDGQMILVSQLMYLAAQAMDGRNDIADIADVVSSTLGQRLSPDGAGYLVENKLRPLGLVTDRVGTPDQLTLPPRAAPLLALTLQGVLIPARMVRGLAAVLAPLFRMPVVVPVLLAVMGFDGWVLAEGQLDTALQGVAGSPTGVLTLLVLTIASLMFHELGHAAGCRFGGGKPGAIGFGVMVIFPCFYTNVTDAYRLDRRGRLRTDLGGIYFNAVFILLLAAGYLLTDNPVLLASAVLGHLVILQQLLPLLRMDGYYILGDLVGIPNLFEQIRPMLSRRRSATRRPSDMKPWVGRVVLVWTLLVVPVLLTSLALMAWRLPGYAQAAWASAQSYWQLTVISLHQGDITSLVVASISLLLLTLPWLGMLVLIARATRRAAGAGWRLLARRI